MKLCRMTALIIRTFAVSKGKHTLKTLKNRFVKPMQFDCAIIY